MLLEFPMVILALDFWLFGFEYSDSCFHVFLQNTFILLILFNTSPVVCSCLSCGVKILKANEQISYLFSHHIINFYRLFSIYMIQSFQLIILVEESPHLYYKYCTWVYFIIILVFFHLSVSFRIALHCLLVLFHSKQVSMSDFPVCSFIIPTSV